MDYPIVLWITYPERVSRLSTLFRPLLIIPNFIAFFCYTILAEVVLILSWFSILCTGKNPISFYTILAKWLRWYTRIQAYSSCIIDSYPPYSGSRNRDYPVCEYFYIPGRQSRWQALLRLPVLCLGFPMALPHGVALVFVNALAIVVTVLSWLAILFNGAYPKVLFRYMVRCIRWNARVAGYSLLLTDQYPPFTGQE